MLNVHGRTRMAEGGGGEAVAARSAAYTQVNAIRIEGVQNPELLGDFQSGVVGQHDTAAPDTYPLGVGGYLPMSISGLAPLKDDEL